MSVWVGRLMATFVNLGIGGKSSQSGHIPRRKSSSRRTASGVRPRPEGETGTRRPASQETCRDGRVNRSRLPLSGNMGDGKRTVRFGKLSKSRNAGFALSKCHNRAFPAPSFSVGSRVHAKEAAISTNHHPAHRAFGRIDSAFRAHANLHPADIFTGAGGFVGLCILAGLALTGCATSRADTIADINWKVNHDHPYIFYAAKDYRELKPGEG